MEDRNSERERRVKEMMRRRDNGQELGILSQGQAEISNIQGELANDIALQRVQDQARLQTTGVMAQAAEGLLAMDSGGQPQQVLSQQVGNMNAGTQAIMKKYGVKPENSTKTSSTNSKVSVGSSTTNIRNEYVTNNRTEIKITQPQIPIAQPQISVAPVRPQATKDNTLKFKTWLSEMFAKQQNDAEIQKKEYRKKEWNLARTTTRLMKRIESSVSNMSTRLDPERMTSSLGGQLKWLLLIFGAALITKVWKPMMGFLANLEGGFRAVFGLPINEDLRKHSGKGLSIVDKIREFIGISKDDKETSLIKGIGKVFTQGIQKLIDRIDFWFEDRSIALREIKMPEINLPKISVPGFDGLLSGMSDTLKGVGQYIGEIITVALGGSKGRVKAEANRIRSQSISTFTNTNGKQVSAGDNGLLSGKGRSYMRESDFGVGGILKSNASSTQAMSRSISSLINDRSQTSHSAEIASGVQQIFDVARRKGQVVIDPEMLSSMGFNSADIYQLKQNKDLIQVPYKIIYVKATEKDLADEDRVTSWNKTGASITGGILGVGAGVGAGALMGAPLGVPGMVVGGVIGGLGSLVTSAPAGAVIGAGIGNAVDNQINAAKLARMGLVAKLVPANSSETSADGSPGIPKMMFALTKQGADHVAAKFMANPKAKGEDMNLANKEFYEKIRRVEERNKRRNGVSGPLTQGISVNRLREAQANYDSYLKEYNRRFNADPNDPNNPYRNYDSFVNNVGNAFDDVRGWVAGTIRSVTATGGGRGQCDRAEGIKRINYAMKFFMDNGFTKAQAAGIVGNLAGEGLLCKDLGHEYPDGADRGPSAGIAGFHDPGGGRGQLSLLKEFALENGLNWKDLDTQLRFLVSGKSDEAHKALSKISSLQGEDTNVAVESSRLWAYNYEKFKGYNPNKADYRPEEYRKRASFAKGYLESYNPDNAGYTKYTDKQEAVLKLNGVGGTTEVSSSGIGRIAWIGDSQSIASSCAIPKKVSAKISEPIVYFNITGASPNTFLKNDKREVITNLKEVKVNSGAEAVSQILKNTPEYCIIALGHNGAGNLQNLINCLKDSGIKSIVIKMWPIKDVSKEDMSKRYDGIIASGWVDLSWMEMIELAKDGIHATPKGCELAADEISIQLKTGTRSAWNPNYETSDNNEGLISKIGNYVADIIQPGTNATPEQIAASNYTSGMTLEQKESFNKMVGQIKSEQDFNRKTWEDMAGAKTNDIGTYVDYKDTLTGNTARAYLRTDGSHNALDGIKNEDLDWIEVYGKDGKRLENVSQNYLNSLKNSVLYDKNLLFSDYPTDGGKGSGYNDYMTDSNGRFLFIDLGVFTDIGGFSKLAQKDFKGKIRYFICPSKTCSQVSIIKIPETPYGGLLIFGKEILTEKENFDTEGSKSYGPIIYRRGETWKQYGTLPKDKKYTGGWQPLCYYEGVKLTPKASAEKDKLLKFLHESRGIKRTSRGFERMDGSLLSKEDIEFASKHGLLVGGAVGNPVISKDFDKISREIYYNSKEIKSKSFETLKKYVGETKEDRKKYYEKNKDNFVISDGILYDSATHLKLGRVSEKGEIDLFDNKEFENIFDSEGKEEGLKINSKKISSEQERSFSVNSGMVSRAFAGDFLNQLSNYNRSAKVNIKGKREKALAASEGSFTILDSNGNDVRIPYKAYFFSDGKEKYITFPKKYNDEISVLEKLESSTLDGLKSLVLESNKGRAQAKKTRRANGALWEDNSDIKREETKQSFVRKLLNEGKTISGKEPGGRYVLSDGSRVQDNGYHLDQREIDRVNKAVQYRQNQVRESEVYRLYKESDLSKQHKDLIEKANKDLKNIDVNSNGYAVDKTGVIYGKVTKDKEGNITGVKELSNSKDILSSATSMFEDNPYLKRAFYEKALGGNLERIATKEGINSYKKIKAKNGNTYYVKANLDEDISSYISNGGSSTILSNELLTYDNETGEFKKASVDNQERNEIISQLSKLSTIADMTGLTKDAIEILTGNSKAQAEEAAEQRREQEIALINQKAEQEKTNIYLETVAKYAAEELGGEEKKEFEQKIDRVDSDKKEQLKNADQRYNDAVNPKNKEGVPKTIGKPDDTGKLNINKSWKTGGFTTPGNPNEVAGIVHNNEFVANARLTSKYRPLFEMLDMSQKEDFAKNGVSNNETPKTESTPVVKNGDTNVINSGNTYQTVNNYSNSGSGLSNFRSSVGGSGTSSNNRIDNSVGSA